MTMKEWTAEYKRLNEWEQQERIARLPRESVEDSVHSYFALCEMMASFSVEAEKSASLREQQRRHYLALIEKWKRLAHQPFHAAQP